MPVICLLLAEMGCTRAYSPAHIVDLWARLGALTKAEMTAQVTNLSPKEQAAYTAMLALFDTSIVAGIPRIPAKGGVKFKGEVVKE